MAKIKYYNLTNIKKKKATYNVIFGERSNGKTYAGLMEVLENYNSTGKQGAYIRRWDEDIKAKRAMTLFDNHISNGEIERLTNGKWTSVYYYASKFFLCRYDEDVRVTDEKPFMHVFALSGYMHDKSTSYPDVTTIIFDEFMDRTRYLPDEFVIFMNVISTIVRKRTDVTIYMLANTVNKYCPYFNEMGLTHIKQQQQDTIEVYSYGNSDLRVAVEYTESTKVKDSNNKYFAFNNPRINMITSGAWEIDIYPHCPIKIKPKQIKFTYFIVFDDEILQCDIVKDNKDYFTFIHRKTTELKDADNDIIYSTEYDKRSNWKRKITKPTSSIERHILSFYQKDKIFYASNDVGEVVRNYLIWCGKSV